MSWNPLKKLGSKQTSPVGSSGLALTRQEDMEKLINRLNQTETTIKKMCKDVKKLTDCILSVNRYDSKMTADISNSVLCQQYDNDLRNLVESWHTFNCEVNQAGEDLVLNIQKAVVEPIKRLQVAFGEVKAAIKRRDQLRQECIKYKSKVIKLSEKEKTGPNIVKVEAARATSEKLEAEFEAHNNILAAELPQLIDARIDYFQTSLEAFIRSEAYYWGECINSFNTHSEILAHSIGSNCMDSWADYAVTQQNLLHQISSLSIVDGDEK